MVNWKSKLIPGFLKRALLKRALRKSIEAFLDKPEVKEILDMALIKALFTSKKAGAIVAAILTVLLRELLGLDEATVSMIVNLVIGYLFAQGAVDVALVVKNLKK